MKTCPRGGSHLTLAVAMSYLHCPTCKRAFNIAVNAQCPSCPVPATLVDPVDDIVAAAEQLARAMARANPNERADAMQRMDRLALPAPDAKPASFHGALLRTIRDALDPPAALPPPSRPQHLLPAIALSLVRRAEARAPLLFDGLRRARERVRALAA